jgi:DNA mismatch repair protein MutS2
MGDSQDFQTSLELDLHSLHVDECLLKTDQYLYDAYVAQLQCVRLVHGKGTGTLRQAVRKHLAKHPLVKSFRPAAPFEGGDGATVVELVD